MAKYIFNQFNATITDPTIEFTSVTATKAVGGFNSKVSILLDISPATIGATNIISVEFTGLSTNEIPVQSEIDQFINEQMALHEV